MAWSFVGKGTFNANAVASNPSWTAVLPAGTQAGDLLILQIVSRGNYNWTPPAGWTGVQAVNNNDYTSGFSGKPTTLTAYIVRGAGAPNLAFALPGAVDRVVCVIAAYRASGTITYVGASLLSESAAASAHVWASIAGLNADDLLVMGASHGANYAAGAAVAATDPSTASPAHSGSVDGALSSAAPATGAWLNREHLQWSTGSDGGVFIADGVKASNGDTGAIQFSNAVGFVVAGAVMAFRASAAGPDTITLTDPPDLTVYEGAAGSRSVTFGGTHTGATSTIQIQIERVADSSVALAWTTLASSVAAGAFSGAITVPRGGWYIARVRKVSDNTVTDATATTFGVGVVLGGLGQSHLQALAAAGTAGATNPRVVTHSGSAISVLGTTGAGQLAFLADVAAAFDCPVMWIQASNGGTGVDYWYTAGGGTTANYNAWAAKVTAAGARLSAFIWWQGDFNTQTGDTKASYTTLMTNLVNKVRVDFIATYCVVGVLGRKGGGTDSAWQPIRSAHVDYADDANNFGFQTYDLEQGPDQQHFTDAAYLVVAPRIALCIKRAYGLATYSRGPVVASAVYNGALVDVTITHDGSASDVAPSSGQTGWMVLDGSTAVSVTAAVRLNATKVRLTLASAPAGAVSVRYAWGAYPTVTGVVKDNSALALPMRPTDADIVASFSSSLDGTPPTLTGSITPGTITTTSIQFSWPAGSDNVAVTSYECSRDGGSTWTDTGSTGLTYTYSGLTASTAYAIRVRAKDAAGNVSTPPLSASISTSSPAATATTVTLPLTTDGTTPAASLSGLKWAFFDQVTPDLLLAPTAKGAAESTDSSGVLTASIVGTALLPGATGWLIVTNSDGTTTQSPAHKLFAGPVTVS